MQKSLLSSAIIGLLLSSSAVIAVETTTQATGAAPIAVETTNQATGTAPAASSEMAAQPDSRLREKFQALDKNHDGKIDRKEAKADQQLHKSFKKIAKKGKLDESGYINWQQAQQPRG